MSEMLDARLAYAASGLLTFPAPRGQKKSYKSSKYSNGQRWGATLDPEQIKADCRRWPDANIGICTGPESGIFVVEADTKAGHGVDGIAALAKLGPPLPPTRQAESPSGSQHYYFRYPLGGFVIRNSQGKLAPGVDVRGEGGMVIAPPSVRDDGIYHYVNTLPVANAPNWLLRLVIEKPRPPQPPRLVPAAHNEPPASGEYLIVALYQIDPDIDQTAWFQIGCALLNELGAERGFRVWDEWSSSGAKYKQEEMAGRWQYLVTKRYPYSIRTIEHFSEQAKPGWWWEFEQETIELLNQAAANSALRFGHKDEAA